MGTEDDIARLRDDIADLYEHTRAVQQRTKQGLQSLKRKQYY